jgi:DNA polymerase III epsilon subunit-like protein
MKLHNHLLVLDLETTDNPRARRIIELGCVLLDRQLDVLDTFDQLVRPAEPLSEFVTKLTGITDADLAVKPYWPEVAGRWEEWLRQRVPNIKQVRLACWGNYFDVNVLRQEYEGCGREYPFSGTALDVKSLAFLWTSLSGRRTDSLGLPHVCQTMEFAPPSRWHRAHPDAWMTAAVLRRVFSDLGGGVFLPGNKYHYVEVRG